MGELSDEDAGLTGPELKREGRKRLKRHCSSPPGASNLVGKANIRGPHVMCRIIVECQEQNKVKVQLCLAGQGCSHCKIC